MIDERTIAKIKDTQPYILTDDDIYKYACGCMIRYPHPYGRAISLCLFHNGYDVAVQEFNRALTAWEQARRD